MVDWEDPNTIRKLADEFLGFCKEGKLDTPVDIIEMCDRELAKAQDRITLLNGTRRAAVLAAEYKGYVIGVVRHG